MTDSLEEICKFAIPGKEKGTYACTCRKRCDYQGKYIAIPPRKILICYNEERVVDSLPVCENGGKPNGNGGPQ